VDVAQIYSMKSFVRPYGLVAETSNVSSTGTLFGSPYTVADDEKTMFLQSNLIMTLSKLTVPLILDS